MVFYHKFMRAYVHILVGGWPIFFLESAAMAPDYESLYRKVAKDVKAPVVVVNFWASWCGPCLKEFPSLKAFLRRLGPETAHVIAINTDQVQQDLKIRKTVDRHQLPFAILADKGDFWKSQFRVKTLPFSVVYVRGKVFRVFPKKTNFMKRAFLRELKALLSRPQAEIEHPHTPWPDRPIAGAFRPMAQSLSLIGCRPPQALGG